MKPFCSEWLNFDKKAGPDPVDEPTPTPAPQTPPAAAPEPEMKPLQDADKNRAPAPVNPTGNPEQKPVPLSELLGALESAGKSSIDAGLSLDKSMASLDKVKTMGGVSDQERQIMSKSEEFHKRLSELRRELSSISEALSKYRLSLASGTAQGWLE